ncbi:serine hydrolase [Mobilicoccus massiliensis]|uniref:serine hydrolase n=1 Tax=Mobilicoccus massiliensis TaxID=1522310 RepID=UPI0009E200DD|nr:serine hydrolase [Mobilicoccus massiliensis]
MGAWWACRRAGVVGGVVAAAMACAPAVAVPSASAVPPGPENASAAPAASDRKSPSFSDRDVARMLGKGADDVSFSVRDRRTGETYTYNGGFQNTTASIVKVLVLTTIVGERREDGRGLSSKQRALAERMIRYSDNDATTSLFSQAGGRAAVQRTADDLGMTRTKVKGAWGTTTTSAADQRLLMDKLVDGTPHLEKRDRAYILELMGRVTPEQRWGVGSVPKGTSVAVKNGWLPLEPHGWRINSIGSVKGDGRDYTLAILSYDNGSMESGVTRARKVSEYVWKTLGSSADVASEGATPSGTRPTPFWIRRGAALPPHPIV